MVTWYNFFSVQNKNYYLGGVPHVMMTGDTGGTGVYRSKQVNAHNHFGGDSLKKDSQRRARTKKLYTIYDWIARMVVTNIENNGTRCAQAVPPSKYYTGPTMFNFRDQTRTGVFIVDNRTCAYLYYLSINTWTVKLLRAH